MHIMEKWLLVEFDYRGLVFEGVEEWAATHVISNKIITVEPR